MTVDPFADVSDALRDFETIAGLAGHSVTMTDVTVNEMPAPHRPVALQKGFGAVYCFTRNRVALKVGRTTNNARFQSHHYASGRSTSSLASSLIDDAIFQGIVITDFHDLPGWIRTNTGRIDLVLERRFGPEVLNLLEAFLIARWRPRYEGRAT